MLALRLADSFLMFDVLLHSCVSSCSNPTTCLPVTSSACLVTGFSFYDTDQRVNSYICLGL